MLFQGSFSMELKPIFSGFGCHGNHYYGKSKIMVLKNKFLASIKNKVNYTLAIIL